MAEKLTIYVLLCTYRLWEDESSGGISFKDNALLAEISRFKQPNFGAANIISLWIIFSVAGPIR